MRVEHHRLVSPEVRGVDLAVIGTVVFIVDNVVPVPVLLANVPGAVAVGVELLRVVLEPAVVPDIWNTIVVRVRVALVALAVFVHVVLVRVGDINAVVHGVRDAVAVLVVVGVTHVSKRVLVSVGLVGVSNLGTVVACVPQAVAISVLLVFVEDERAVVPLIQDAIVVLRKTSIEKLITDYGNFHQYTYF